MRSAAGIDGDDRAVGAQPEDAFSRGVEHGAHELLVRSLGGLRAHEAREERLETEEREKQYPTDAGHAQPERQPLAAQVGSHPEEERQHEESE
jgi:hypothetical protein